MLTSTVVVFALSLVALPAGAWARTRRLQQMEPAGSHLAFTTNLDLMRQGYTVVDAGWQGDVAPGSSRLVPGLPVATQADGSPIVARVRIECSDRTIPQAGTFTLPLEGSNNFRSYETVSDGLDMSGIRPVEIRRCAEVRGGQ